ncbi:MAG: hypothetical protein ACK5FE_07225 [Cyanobacteriota bacterium]|jgi:hypothetical protein
MATPTLSPGPAPFRVQSRYTLNDIKDYDRILHGGASTSVASKYTYQGAQDVNGDGFVEVICYHDVPGFYLAESMGQPMTMLG